MIIIAIISGSSSNTNTNKNSASRAQWGPGPANQFLVLKSADRGEQSYSQFRGVMSVQNVKAQSLFAL